MVAVNKFDICSFDNIDHYRMRNIVFNFILGVLKSIYDSTMSFRLFCQRNASFFAVFPEKVTLILVILNIKYDESNFGSSIAVSYELGGQYIILTVWTCTTTMCTDIICNGQSTNELMRTYSSTEYICPAILGLHIINPSPMKHSMLLSKQLLC